MGKERLLAVVWDFDGTLADTRERNLDVTRSILMELGKDPSGYGTLKDKHTYTEKILSYKDWRGFSIAELGLAPQEAEYMGRMWGEHQLKSEVAQELYPGIDEVIRKAADLGLPQGVFSVNSEKSISNFLDINRLSPYFGSVVGHEQLSGPGKPDPEGLIRCIYQLGQMRNSGTVLYIGDHATDILAAEYANRIMAGRMRNAPIHVESIHASYIYGDNLPEGAVPNRKAEKPSDITSAILEYKPMEVV